MCVPAAETVMRMTDDEEEGGVAAEGESPHFMCHLITFYYVFFYMSVYYVQDNS